MFRKYALVLSVLAVLGTPSVAQAQTMDIVMKLQSILDQFSEIRSQMKQVQSSMNIQSMLKNLGGDGGWKNALKKAAGSIFDKATASGGQKQALMVLPDGLSDKAGDPEAAQEWMLQNLFVHKEKPTVDDLKEMSKKRQEFKYTAALAGYGKAVAMRKQLDKDIETIEKLRQDAEGKEAETDLQNEINKIALLKLEQTNYQQLLISTQAHIKGANLIVNMQSVAAARDKK